jgi:tetratricopeptide (TPR) repeat protein
LEAAILALQDAKLAWDEPAVRRDIEECTQALLNRRDRVSVADFEVRGDAGDANVGKTIADALLPTLKSRYDLMDRAQLARALKEQNVQATELAGNLKGQPELADLLRTRYLVLGSVTRFGGWIADARLVDLRTGLVIQTGKVTAAFPEDLVRVLPDLGAQLMMSDEERKEIEKKQGTPPPVVVKAVDANAPIPPPPVRPVVNAVNRAPVPPAFVNFPQAPVAGGFALADLNRFPLQPPLFLPQAVPALPVGPLDAVIRARLLRVAIDVGDQFFLLGQFADALRQYQLAFSLAPGEPLVLDRLNNLAPFVGLVNPVLFPPVVRQRIVVFDFLTPANTGVVPPFLGPWTADNLAPYFAFQFDVVDRQLAYWFMARLGLSLRDVATDPSARFWLGRALNVRYFVFGALVPTASFDARTSLVDAELSFLVGEGRLHVRTPFELKLRLAELAQITMLNPIERAQFVRTFGEFQKFIDRGRELAAQKNFAQALKFFNLALAMQPGNIEALFHIQRTREQEWAAARVAPFGVAREPVALLLEREKRRNEIGPQFSKQFASNRDQRLRQADDRRKAVQEVDRKASQQLLSLAQKQMSANKPKEALAVLQAARRLQSSETVDALLAKAKTAIAPTPSSPSTPSVDPKNQAEFKRLLAMGTNLRKNKQWNAAKNALNEALKLKPGDREVTAELKKADDGILSDSWMAKGRKALEDRNYAEAVKFYTKALQVVPDEPDAKKAMRFAVGMQTGSALFKQEKYKQASHAFREARDAARSGPFFDRAQQPLNQAEYRHNMAEGKKALKKGQKEAKGKERDDALRDAVRYFEAALRIYPADQEANQSKQLAQKLLKK